MKPYYSSRHVSVDRDRITFFIDKLSIQFYWIDFQWSKMTKGFFAPTSFLYRPNKNWEWEWAVVIRVFGFGIGLCWKHLQNPIVEEKKINDNINRNL